VPAWLNGAPGLVVLDHGAVTTAIVLEIVGARGGGASDGGGGDGGPRIAAFHVVRNPDKLARLGAHLADLGARAGGAPAGPAPGLG